MAFISRSELLLSNLSPQPSTFHPSPTSDTWEVSSKTAAGCWCQDGLFLGAVFQGLPGGAGKDGAEDRVLGVMLTAGSQGSRQGC